MALMPSEAEVGGRAQEEVVEIQVGGVERVVQAPTQAKCFDLACKTRERLPILIAATSRRPTLGQEPNRRSGRHTV